MSVLSSGWPATITISLVLVVLFLILRDPVANSIEKTFVFLWSAFKTILGLAILVALVGGILGAIIGVIRFGWNQILP